MVRLSSIFSFASAFSISPNLKVTALPLIAACAASVLAVGCAGSDSTDSAGADQTVKPGGSDTRDGKLLVMLPDVATKSKLTNTTTFSVDATPVVALEAGTPASLRAGHYCIEMKEENNGTSSVCDVDVASLKTTLFEELGTVTYKPAAPDAPEGWEFISAKITATASADIKSGSFADERLGGNYLRFASKYRASFGLFDGVDYTVSAGQITTVDLGSFAQRRSFKVLPPASRDFPNAASCDETLTISASKGNEARQQAFPMSKGPIVVGEYGADGSDVGVYTASMGGDFKAPVFLGANVGDAPAVLQLGRLDIDDVTVKVNDGTTETRPGVYTIEAVTQENGQRKFLSTCATKVPTKTGATVLPGTYRITTTFPTQDGSAPDVQTVTVP